MLDFYYFMVEGYVKPVGYVHRDFIEAVPWPDCWQLDHQRRLLTLFGQGSFDERTDCVQRTLRLIFEKGNVVGLRGWTGEVFPVYDSSNMHIMDMDRCGVERFGIKTFGVHLTAFTRTENLIRYWVPQRSDTKPIYPGMLDNSVGGALGSSEKPLNGIIREIAEEAGISESYTRANLVQCDVLSYSMSKTSFGKPACQHNNLYAYEMEWPPNLAPKVTDGEVGQFHLMSLESVREHLLRRAFLPTGTMTWIAYLVRHNILNAENEPDLGEICARLHRKHDLFIV